MTDEPAEIAHSGALPSAPERSTMKLAGTKMALRRGWILWLAAVLPAAAGLLLLAGSLDAPIPESYGFRGFLALFAGSFGSVGAFILTRRPGNRVGGILLAVGIVSGILGFLVEYANVGLIAAPGSLPAAIWVAWVASWAWVPIVVLTGPLLLSLYPDGRFLSGRWQSVALFGVALGTLTMLGIALEPGPMNNFRFVDNPAGVLPASIMEPLAGLANVGLVLVLTLSAASLVVRFRRADRDSRQQLKWFALAAIVLAVVGPLGFVGGKIGSVIFVVALCGIPVATGLAVLRYGLYEIDTVINRALVYGLLTGILAGLYTASVGLMQRVSKAATGADSDAAIVLTTLIVVTAFTPVKNRLQRLVDQRFKENKDPATRLKEFVAVVRDALSPLDAQKTLRRFLRVVVEAGDVPGGRIELAAPAESAWSASIGEEPVEGHAVVLSAPLGGGTVRLVISPPERTGVLSARDRAAVEEALTAVVEELSSPGRGPAESSLTV
jgi:hypothetical protein